MSLCSADVSGFLKTSNNGLILESKNLHSETLKCNGINNWKNLQSVELHYAVLYVQMVFNSFTGNSVILRHSCYKTVTLLIHCKLRFCSQQYIFQRKSLLACQIHWIDISPQH